MTDRTRPPGFEPYRPGGAQSAPPRRPELPKRPPTLSELRARGGGSRGNPGVGPGAGMGGSGMGGGGLFKAAAYVVLGVVAVVGLGIGYLSLFPPTDLIRTRLVEEVKARTGRTLAIEGPASLTFFPTLGVVMDRVSLSAPPAMGGSPLVAMEQLKVGVKVLPLLQSRVEIDQFVLTRPTFTLRVDKSGRKNWSFAADETDAARPTRLAAAGATRTDAEPLVVAQAGGAATSSTGRTASLDGVALGDVRIIAGTIHHVDDTTGRRHSLTDVDLTVALPAMTSPLTASGAIGYKGQKVGLTAAVTTPGDILSARPARILADIKSTHLLARYDGRLSLAGGDLLDGALAAETGDLRQLVRWLSGPLPQAKGFGPASVAGRLKVTSLAVSLLGADIGLDGATATGDVVVTTSGQRPHVAADLKVSELDLNKYRPGARAGARDGDDAVTPPQQRRGDVAPAAGATRQADGRTAPASIDDLLRDPETRVRGYTAREGWSNETIDVTPLAAADADLKIDAARLLVGGIATGRTLLTVTLRDRVLRASLNEMQLYSGRGTGIVTLDAAAGPPAITSNISLDGVSASPLLKDAAGIEWLSGTGKLALVLAAQGASERQIVEALDGTASFVFTNGAVRGFNIPQAIRGMSQGRMSDLSAAPEQTTDFSRLSISFKITDGLAESTDLAMQSPLLRVAGEGKVMLPEREVDYLVRPKLVANLTGQGGATGLTGLEIPVRIHGPFGNLDYTPDLKGIFGDPAKATEAIKQIGEQLKGKDGKAILDSLLGGGKPGDPKSDPKKLLDGLLGGSRQQQ
ncbi:MAG: AsmA family protein [Hyphomicrobiaceae bacterium]|nr:AsmA family protein [Hyphomicrobiaceae bacterium]